VSIELGPKTETFTGWARTATIDGVAYRVSVARGKPVRIPYKPRGQNRGFKWNGTVYANGKCLFYGDVPGSIGARGLLARAGVKINNNDEGATTND
jgi:hypothetical protein